MLGLFARIEILLTYMKFLLDLVFIIYYFFICDYFLYLFDLFFIFVIIANDAKLFFASV